MPKVKDEVIEGRSLPVSVNEDGQFFIDVGSNQWIKANTLGKVVAQARLALRKQRAAIPVTLIRKEGYGESARLKLQDGVLIGRHAGNNNLLFRAEGSATTEQISEYDCKPCPRLSGGEKTMLQDLYVQKLAAEDAFDSYVKKLRLNVTEALAKQEEKAGQVEKGPEKESPDHA